MNVTLTVEFIATSDVRFTTGRGVQRIPSSEKRVRSLYWLQWDLNTWVSINGKLEQRCFCFCFFVFPNISYLLLIACCANGEWYDPSATQHYWSSAPLGNCMRGLSDTGNRKGPCRSSCTKRYASTRVQPAASGTSASKRFGSRTSRWARLVGCEKERVFWSGTACNGCNRFAIIITFEHLNFPS